MLQMQAVDAAREIYNHGKHVILSTGDRKEMLSLKSLAISAKRKKVVPSFGKFESYFSQNYAHDLIVKSFNTFSEVEDLHKSKNQMTTLIVDALRYQVLYIAALQKAYKAVEGCKSQTQTQVIQAKYDWDTAAAYIIGSMQKPSNSITSTNVGDGYLMWALGLSLCDHFNTCPDNDWAAANNMEILNTLYIGSFQLSVKSQQPQRSCEDL